MCISNICVYVLMYVLMYVWYLAQGLKLSPRLDTFDLRDAIDKAVTLFGRGCFDKRVKVLPIPASPCSHVISDRQWLQENIMCLISNAVKYCPYGDITVAVQHVREATPAPAPAPEVDESAGQQLSPQLSTVSSAGRIRIEIEDAGVGISEENKARLFNPFNQAQRRAGGTGLGLYSLAQRIQALGGDYGVR